MITIRRRQVDAFWALRDRDLAPKVIGYLHEVEPQRSVALRGSLETWVEEQLVRARELQVNRAWDRCRFVRYELTHGPRFEARCPWAAHIFARAELDGTGRMDRIEFVHRNYLAGRRARDHAAREPI